MTLPRLGGDLWVTDGGLETTLVHAELDEANELDRGDITELGALYASLGSMIDLRVIGGCCGTDHEHVATIASALDGIGKSR